MDSSQHLGHLRSQATDMHNNLHKAIISNHYPHSTRSKLGHSPMLLSRPHPLRKVPSRRTSPCLMHQHSHLLSQDCLAASWVSLGVRTKAGQATGQAT
jgi:hypothetical protein